MIPMGIQAHRTEPERLDNQGSPRDTTRGPETSAENGHATGECAGDPFASVRLGRRRTLQAQKARVKVVA